MKHRIQKVARRADKGTFCSPEFARKNPRITVVETMKMPVKKGKR